MQKVVEVTSWVDDLKAAGLRVTRQRLAVLHAVHAEPHVAADVVVERVRSDLGAISTQAVYDTLNALTERGILRRFEPAGSSMRFEISTGDNHHHLVCRSCGSVTDVACAVGSIPCAVPPDTAGVVVDEAEVTYWGLCAACAAQSASRMGLRQTEPGPTESGQTVSAQTGPAQTGPAPASAIRDPQE